MGNLIKRHTFLRDFFLFPIDFNQVSRKLSRKLKIRWNKVNARNWIRINVIYCLRFNSTKRPSFAFDRDSARSSAKRMSIFLIEKYILVHFFPLFFTSLSFIFLRDPFRDSRSGSGILFAARMISLLRTWGYDGDEDIDMPGVLDRVQAARNSGVRFLCAQCRLRSHHYAKHSIPREPQDPRTQHLATRLSRWCWRRERHRYRVVFRL